MSGHIPWRCLRRGHDWFPPIEQREFLVWTSTCLRGRCTAQHVELPWGTCIGLGKQCPHAIAEHYRVDGSLIEEPVVNGCSGPR